MIQMETIGERIRAERKRLGLSQEAFASLGGSSKPSQVRYESGERSPDGDYFAGVAAAGADVLYILTGGRTEVSLPQTAGDMIAAMQRQTAFDGLVVGLPDDVVDDLAGFIRLPRYTVEASAGPGINPGAELTVDVIAFDRQFLRDRGASPDQCTVIRARGDSMMPTIPDGSLLVVDHSQREISNGYITVISIGDDLLVKRIRRRLDGLVELISDNAAYAPELIATDRLEQLRIVGRVVYFCRVP